MVSGEIQGTASREMSIATFSLTDGLYYQHTASNGNASLFVWAGERHSRTAAAIVLANDCKTAHFGDASRSYATTVHQTSVRNV